MIEVSGLNGNSEPRIVSGLGGRVQILKTNTLNGATPNSNLKNSCDLKSKHV